MAVSFFLIFINEEPYATDPYSHSLAGVIRWLCPGSAGQLENNR